MPSRPAPSEPGLLPRSPALPPAAPVSLCLEVTFSPEAARWVRQQEGLRSQVLHQAAGAPRTPQAWVLGL